MGVAFAVDYKRNRVMISEQCLEIFNVIQMNFCVDSFVDKTWIHYFTSETKEQSK